MTDIGTREETLAHSQNPDTAEAAKDLIDARSFRIHTAFDVKTHEPLEAAGPATFAVIQLPCGFRPVRFAVERRVPLVGGGTSVVFYGTPTDDPEEAEMLAFSAARNEAGARTAAFVGPHSCGL